MSITIPSELQWLGWIAGSDWPDGDEDKMWAIGADWRQAAADIRALLPDLAAARKATIEAYPWGDGVEEMTAALDKLDRGPESLEQLAEILDYVVESADALGTEIEYTKILVISSLAMLAFEIAAAWFFPPTAPLVEAAAIGVTRVAVRLLGQRAVSAIARFAAKTGLAALAKFSAKHVVFSTVLGAGQDAAIQAYQVGAGHRDGIDWNRVGTTAYTAAAAGAVGGPVGGLLGKAATKVPLPAGRWSGALKGAAVGAGSGMAGALGAWGVGGFANGWTWDPRLLTGGAAYGVLTGGSKGFRHAPPGRGPGGRGFNAPTPGRFGGDGSSARVRVASGADGAGIGSTHRSGDSSANGAGNRDVSTGNHPGETSNRSGNQPEGSSNTNSGAQASRGIQPHPAFAGGDGSQPKPSVTASEAPRTEPSTPRADTDARSTGAEPRAGTPERRPTPAGAETPVHASTTGKEASQNRTPGTEKPHAESRVPGAERPQTAEARRPAEVPDQIREKLRGLGVDLEGMSPEQIHRAGLDAATRRLSELVTSTADLDAAGLPPNEHLTHRKALQRQINEVLALRNDLRSEFENPRNSTPGKPDATTHPRPETSPGNENTSKPTGERVPTEPRRPAEIIDSIREKVRALGVDPDGMTPDQLRRAGTDALARRADEFAEQTTALEGAGLHPNDLLQQRMELQRQIDEFLTQRKELRSEFDQYSKQPEAEGNPSANPPTPEQHPAPEPTRQHPEGERPQPATQTPTAEPHTTPDGERTPDEIPDTTSKIPYTPRYFGVPPIPEYEAPTPPDDAVWEPKPKPER
ncbi:hypothetical protein F3087_27940 [Nocardia colli]|uniref:Outer membrane channel protein CpnT-like N-terminal domain-containing protein n=1 Tax=Nocardia colli TaxID=2545717 RepID=A0A5N0EDF2_9NOCA|nr:hypothetical protein [Nocardia colli]KAA8885471.1 hypothetical protein F3087_27940 [Nocardia colli]